MFAILPLKSLGLLLLPIALLAAEMASAQEKPVAPKINVQVVQILVKSALMALNHANLTGNYSVLRELGTVEFQASTSSATLSDAFAGQRRTKLDLAGTLVYPAVLNSAPQVKENQIRFTGLFKTQPQQVRFDISYRFVNGRWRINGLSVGLSNPGEVTSGNAAETVMGKTDLNGPNAE